MNSSGMIINSSPGKFSEFHDKEKVLISVKDGKFNIFFILITFVNLLYLWANKEKVINLFKLVHHHKFFLPSIIIIFFWCIFIFIFKGYPFLNSNHPAIDILEKSTQAGLFALIIALFAYTDIVIPVFWLVMLVHFIFNDPKLE